MRRRPAAALVASVVLLVLVGVPGLLAGSRPSGSAAARHTAAPGTATVLDALAALPLGFEPNVGQAEPGVDFVARGPGYRLALSATEAGISLPGDGGSLTMRLVGSDPTATATGLDALPGRTNYLTGADPSAWREDVPTFAKVSYAGVWPGVDVVFLGDQRRLRHDFVVAPGADPAAIAVELSAEDAAAGSSSPTIDPVSGELVAGAARLSRPVLYQDVDGRRLPVDGAFRLLAGTRVGFTVGDYDRRHPLVIDPTLVTSSYLGGAGIDTAAAVEVDGGGNVYIAGSTESSDFRTNNPVQQTLNGDGSPGKSDAFVVKLNPEGTTLLFATYLGGTNRDAAAGVAVAPDGSVFVAGVTESDNFPKTSPAAQENYGGGPSDAFVTKLNSTGSSVAWSTFLGGTQTDAARGVAVSAAGEAFVTGSTNSVEYPSANPLQQAAPRPDDVDAFVTKVATDGASFAFSTRLGGSNDDHGLDIAVDATGNAYVTGDTRSPGFPTARPLQAGAGGSASGVAGSFSDAFVTKFGPAGNNLVYSTFLGGSDTDQGTSIAVDGQGAAYVTGITNSPNFPIQTPLQERKDSDTDAFVTKINPAGSAFAYSTFLGGSGADSGGGIVVDGGGAATVVGTTGSTNFPTAKPFQGVKGGGATDAFVSTLSPTGDTLAASSYLGGRDDDQATGIALGAGTATPVAVGSTGSADFPTAKPLQSARAGAATDAFVTRISGAEAEAPATTSGGAAGAAGTAAPESGSSTHDKRVRLLVATTAGLFLIAVLQTAYLRRKATAEAGQWGPEQPEPLLPPAPVQTWGGGVRVIDEEDADDNVFANYVEDDPSGEMTVASGSAVAVPDLLEEDWVSEVSLQLPSPPPAAPGSHAASVPPIPSMPPVRPAPRVPLEELSFWDLFPEDLPPSRRAMDDADWALEDQEDVLVGQSPTPSPMPPPLPPPPVAGPWGEPEPPPPPPPVAEPEDDNLLLTELLDLSPEATQRANATHYGNLIGAGGGNVGGATGGDLLAHDDLLGHDDDLGDDDHDEEDDDDEGDGTVRRPAGTVPVRSGSGSSGSGKRKPKPKRSGKRRPKPGGGGPGSASGAGGPTPPGGGSGGAGTLGG